MSSLSPMRKLRSLIIVTLSGFGTYAGISYYKNDEKFYKNYVMPMVHLLDEERAHRLGIIANKYRLIPKSKFIDTDLLKIKVFGKEFQNPIGIAAGFDKDGEAIQGLQDIGFGFVEIGSVTPEPQPGNIRPRLFRLITDLAVINRYGFNSEGHDAVYERLETLKQSKFSGIIGVNLGKNKRSSNPVDDYVRGVEKFGNVADYLVINVSSPNTPGLRDMQNKENLSDLLKAVIQARNNLPKRTRPSILLKLAPDLTYQERKDIAKVINQKECKVDGLIISNTTIQRPDSLQNERLKNETGGLSGRPLKDMSTKMISDMYKLTHGIPIIGVGGISSGKDAYEKIKAGAAILQIYTAMVYEGPPVVTKIKKELMQLLIKDGYSNIREAVGKSVK